MPPPVLAAPRVAWPTLLLLVAALAIWATGVALVDAGRYLGIPIATLGAYLAFTPMHDAAHRAVARARWVNALVGRIAIVPLFGPFPAVRFLHLEHHKHTNDPVADPDHYSGRGPRALLPLRWLTQDLYYYAVYLGRTRPLAERVEAYATFAALVAAAVVLAASGHTGAVVLGWLVPARIVVAVLAFAFDYLPHRPHAIPARLDRFAATRVFEGPVLNAASLGQSLHRVHHLYPGVPFYRYAAVWRAGLARPSS